MEPVLLPVWPDSARVLGVGRTKVFELIATGQLASVRIGRRRLIPVEALRDLADRLVAEQVGTRAS